MLTSFSAAYRTLLPHTIRAPLWHFRSVAEAVVARERWTYRDRLSDFYTSIGHFRPTVRTPAGTRLRVDLRDSGVGRPIFVNEQYEPAETRLITGALRPGDVFVDIGANIGFFTTLASRLVGPGGRVIAFEPDPDHCATLRSNLRLNGARNVTVRSEALGAQSTSGRLFRSDSNFGDHRVAAGAEPRQSIPILIRRFDEVSDELSLTRVDFIKMDVQGYEPQVLEGMGDCLQRLQVQTVLMEFWPFGIRYAGGSPPALMDTLARLPFVMHTLDEAGDVRAEEPQEILDRVEAMNRELPLTFANLVLQRRRS
jgi:FkbM family methyltransferase